MINYINIISSKFPGTQCSITGDPSIYDNIIWSGVPILKADLDVQADIFVKDSMWKLIQAERDRRRNDGGYKVGTDWFHSDDTSRIQQLGLVMMGANMPTGILWKTMAGSFVSMTPTLAAQIFQAAAASDLAIFTIAEQKKAAMIASADPASYDCLSGWPLIYGE